MVGKLTFFICLASGLYSFVAGDIVFPDALPRPRPLSRPLPLAGNPLAQPRPLHHVGHTPRQLSHAEPHPPAHYNYEYVVRDDLTGTHFGHAESREGYLTEGEYFVHLPDGRIQRVTYYADETGYHATVTYEGEAILTPVPLPHHGHPLPKPTYGAPIPTALRPINLAPIYNAPSPTTLTPIVPGPVRPIPQLRPFLP
ncbi:hypothetical protein SK128_018910 [Halocaridina rubra]|uniref:Uncharacterized protein n=1 Tax=Halocaridina rubra TaxID=373956 RepID=A0AAN9A1Q2_HALRR